MDIFAICDVFDIRDFRASVECNHCDDCSHGRCKSSNGFHQSHLKLGLPPMICYSKFQNPFPDFISFVKTIFPMPILITTCIFSNMLNDTLKSPRFIHISEVIGDIFYLAFKNCFWSIVRQSSKNISSIVSATWNSRDQYFYFHVLCVFFLNDNIDDYDDHDDDELF